MSRSRSALALVVGMLAACGGNAGTAPDAGTTPDAGTAPDASGIDASVACTFAPPGDPKLPHVDASGAQAEPMIEALVALLPDHADPILLSSLGCGIVSSPGGSGGPSCTLTVGDTDAQVQGDAAQQLFDALGTAGAEPCDDLAHGEFIHLKDVRVNVAANEVHFDDGSSYALPTAANVSVTGAAAEELLAAAGAAAIDDCAADAKVFLVCTRLNAAPECSYVRRPLHEVNGSYLVYTCLPEGVDDPTHVDAARAQALWDALLGAAQAGGYVPDDGSPLSATTVVNASTFRWDGAVLGFALTTGSAQPPPPPPPSMPKR